MEQTTITAGNKLIAEFMGYKYYGHNSPGLQGTAGWKSHPAAGNMIKFNVMLGYDRNSYLCRHHKDLRYYNSWDWLMPVFEKITIQDGRDYDYLISYLYTVISRRSGGFTSGSVAEGFHTARYSIAASSKSTIEAAWLTAVDFIKWYNTHNATLHKR